jgi:undecaprenyl-diphosphatase
MTLLEAVVLGVVQGVTEFLPISSTAHLRIAPELLGWEDPGAAYSAVIQLGTVVAVIVYFWRDLLGLGRAFFQGLVQRKPFGTVESRLAWFVLLGTLPIGVAGLLFKKHIETSLRSLYIVAGGLIVLAVILFLAEKIASHRKTVEQMTVFDGIFIGCCQALALIPGSSRSGTTLTGGLLCGMRREDAARYSFLLSVPATTLAGLLQLKELISMTERPSTAALVVGTVVSFAAGMAAIAGLLRFLRTRTTLVFVVYRVALGALLLVLLHNGVLKPQSGLASKPPSPVSGSSP